MAQRIVLLLSFGHLAVVNVPYLVADEDLTSDDLLVGRSVFHHLRIDPRTLLEEERSILDGTDCSHVANPTVSSTSGTISRLMVARLNLISKMTDRSASRPRVICQQARSEEDQFPEPSFLDPTDSEQHEKKHYLLSMLWSRKHGAMAYHPVRRNVCNEF